MTILEPITSPPNPLPAERLLIFSRYPLPGKAKTRLIPMLGAAGAANLQRQMTEQMLKQVQTFQQAYPVSVEIWYAVHSPDPEADRQLMQDWLGATWIYQPQAQGDLGARLLQANQAAFVAGMQRVVTIGTDCPALDASRMQQAFQLLTQHDLVLGPATDGGYYLIGLGRWLPDLFEGIAWSTETVLSQTVKTAQQLGCSIAYLDPLTDIDRPEDLLKMSSWVEGWDGQERKSDEQ